MTNAKNITPAEAVAEVAQNVATKVNEKIPHQAERVEGIVVEENISFKERIKRFATDKKIIAGASSIVLLTAGVLVVRKRNAEQNDESEDLNTTA